LDGPASADPRVVDKSVDPSGPRQHLTDPAGDRARVVDVDRDQSDRQPLSGDRLLELRGGPRIPDARVHIPALTRTANRGGQTHSAAASHRMTADLTTSLPTTL